MEMSDETWHIVRNIRGVTGFVGPGSKPVPLTDEEAAAIIREEPEVTTSASFQVGDLVNIIDGVFRGYSIFAGYSGRLSEISADGTEVTVVVSTVGRDMSVTLDKKFIEKAKD